MQPPQTTECAAGQLLHKKLGQHPDFPKQGILFYDIFPILRDPILFESLITAFMDHIFTETIPRLNGGKIDIVVGLDARGFLLGPLLALRLGAGFVPIRKAGKLPGKCVQASYAKEYGQDVFELQADAIQKGQNVLVVDDLIATGGSAAATAELIQKAGGKIVENLFIVELTFLKGREKLSSPTWSLTLFDD